MTSRQYEITEARLVLDVQEYGVYSKSAATVLVRAWLSGEITGNKVHESWGPRLRELVDQARKERGLS